MPHVLYVALHRPNRSPSQRFRYEQYVDFLRDNGFDYTLSYLLDADDDRAFYSPGLYLRKAGILAKSIARRLGDLMQMNRYDIIFVQREAFMLGTSLFEQCYGRSRARFIFDFDDAIWLDNVSEANKKLGFLKNAAKTHTITAAADMIFAGNRYLADYAAAYNDNVKIVPTTVDTDKFVPRAYNKPPEAPVEIGWTGSFSTIAHLRKGLPALRRIKARYGERVCFKVIGDASFRDDELGIQGLPWRAETEVQDLHSFDIGIMPLPDDQWTRGKCGFKGLTCMSLAVPTVMSPVGVNTEIVADGINALLADTPEAWEAQLARLIDDATLRRQLGTAGRQTVIERYSVQAWQTRYLALFREAVEMPKRVKTRP